MESLCHEVTWFPIDVPVAHQELLRPIITGLYDVSAASKQANFHRSHYYTAFIVML